jgi:hypothetical protein
VRDVGDQIPPAPLEILQLGRHPVEGGGQLTDLITAARRTRTE